MNNLYLSFFHLFHRRVEKLSSYNYHDDKDLSFELQNGRCNSSCKYVLSAEMFYELVMVVIGTTRIGTISRCGGFSKSVGSGARRCQPGYMQWRLCRMLQLESKMGNGLISRCGGTQDMLPSLEEVTPFAYSYRCTICYRPT